MSNAFQTCLKGFKLKMMVFLAKNDLIGWIEWGISRLIQLTQLKGAKTLSLFHNAYSINQGWTSSNWVPVKGKSRPNGHLSYIKC